MWQQRVLLAWEVEALPLLTLTVSLPRPEMPEAIGGVGGDQVSSCT